MTALPKEMKAWVVREERHGEPRDAMKLETVAVPEPGFGEVIIEVKAAGINYNHLWACAGKPASVSQLHPNDPAHIGGSDAAGVVVAVGRNVRYWNVGDEVITHPNQCCGQCSACNGFEPLSCLEQKAWGFETSFGSFGQYAKVQSQQLLRKPPNLSWAEAACFGLKLFTAYRMLFVSCSIKPNDRVLVWGASGGLGSYAIQLCRAVSAIPICVVSSKEKEEYCRSLGAELFIDRTKFPHLAHGVAGPPSVDARTPDASEASPSPSMREFRRELRRVTGGQDPDIVFEHVGAATFPTSVFVARRLGSIVICGATTGYRLSFDARYLWMHQKQIVGSHGCNMHDSKRASHLVEKGIVKPTLTKTYSFADAALAHQRLFEDGSMGSMAMVMDARD